MSPAALRALQSAEPPVLALGPGAWVHLVDDEEPVRRTISWMLASAGLPVRAYDSAEAFLGGGEEPPTGCLLTDLRLPGIGGLQLIERLGELAGELPVVVISGHADVALAVAAMKAGAVDVIEKPIRRADLLSAVNHALARGRQGAPAETAARRLLDALSRRQRQVLEGVVAGKLNKTIAHELGLSVRTIEDYRITIMAKTGAGNVSELVRIAVAAGL